MHARRIRPDTGRLDRRRLTAAGLSALLPGLGQLFNGRRGLAAIFLIPSLLVLLVGVVLFLTQSPTRLAATIVAPAILGTLLTLNLLLLIWRLVAVFQAFLDTSLHGPTGRAGIIGIVVIAILVALPHLLIYRYGTAFGDTFARVFERPAPVAGGSASPTAAPALDERINVLLVGIDALPNRTGTLTDSMIVVSLDPVGKTISLVSVPRDLIGVPLGNGDKYGPKLNSLMTYANNHPKEFPQGGLPALRGAIGALLGIKIDYTARMDFFGFIKMIDAVGGVDINVTDAWNDPTYDGFGLPKRGFAVTVGKHHFDGVHALAYARARKALGESDFTRAARQQQILIALRDAVTKDGSLLWKLPGLLDAVGDTISTDFPVERLPEIAAIADEIGDGSVTRAVIQHPLVKSKSTQFGSSLVPDLKAIRAVAAKLFPAPGEQPIPWPTPKPTKAPKPSASPSP